MLFDEFHVLRHLGEALDKIRKSEYARLTGQERAYITIPDSGDTAITSSFRS